VNYSFKDSCPFYDNLDEILGASACACLTDVVEGHAKCTEIWDLSYFEVVV